MRALISSLVLVLVVAGCAHSQKTATTHCPKCGAPLFFADPGVTTRKDIAEFALRSKVHNRDEIAADGWIHPGVYCPNGDYGVLYEIGPK